MIAGQLVRRARTYAPKRLDHLGSSIMAYNLVDQANSKEESVALINETASISSNFHPARQQQSPRQIAVNALSPSTPAIKFRSSCSSPQPPSAKVRFVPRQRAKSLLGHSGVHTNNRLSLQISPPTPVLSCSTEEMQGNWSDQPRGRCVIAAGNDHIHGGGSDLSISSHQDNPPPRPPLSSNRRAQVIYDDHEVYDPLKFGHLPTPHFAHDRNRRKSFAKEALSLLYGLNPPPRTRSSTDFSESDTKFPVSKVAEKEVRKSHHTDLNVLNGLKTISSSHSENKLGSDVCSNISGNLIMDGGITGQHLDEKVGKQMRVQLCVIHVANFILEFN